MSAAEETINARPSVERKSVPFLNKILNALSSVRFGVVVLCVLVVLAMVGMLIMQQNVEGFEAYYVSLTPAERSVYGALGIFDIYHSWYFNLVLLVLSLNIVLASIDRFPSSWKYIVDPKVKATKAWLLGLRSHRTIDLGTLSEDEAAEAATRVLAKWKYKPKRTEAESIEYGIDAAGKKDFSVINKRRSTIVFGERAKWNRLGAYVVHVALLTLFLGHFVALQTGFDADVRMAPGEKTDTIQLIQYGVDNTKGFHKDRFNVRLPFLMTCTDIQQRLINENGSIDVTNTMDWRTQLRLDDPAYGSMLADISLNRPLTYRGYKFFQAQTIPLGSARKITLELTPEKGGAVQRVEIDRNGSANLQDGTKVEFADFEADFAFGSNGQPDTRSGEYNNPAAVLYVTPSGAADRTRVFAFAQKLPDNAPVGAAKAGYKWHLADFEKAPTAHILSIKYDPYSAAFIAWYIGGFGLIGALMFVFFLSHKRVWAMVERDENGRTIVVLAGDANRNQIAFEDKFNKIASEIEQQQRG